MAGRVVDSSVLLAYLNGEPSALDLEALLFGADLSAVNLAEVVGKLAEAQREPDLAQRLIETFHLTVHPADEAMAIRVGLLRGETRHLGLSLGGRFCLALSQRLGFPVVTADRAWQALDIGIEIRVIR
jgi:ribonuclease VapC